MCVVCGVEQLLDLKTRIKIKSYGGEGGREERVRMLQERKNFSLDSGKKQCYTYFYFYFCYILHCNNNGQRLVRQEIGVKKYI